MSPLGLKLCSARPTDQADVRRPEVLAALDWERLEQVAGEMQKSALNDRRYAEFLGSYLQYREEYAPCDR